MAVDPFLLALVRSLEQSEGAHPILESFSVVLHVGGGVVTGTAISSDRYFERLGRSVSAALGAGDAKPMFGGIAETIREKTRARRGKGKDVLEFIHLEDPAFMLGGTVVNAPLWRGRLDRIDGFALGSKPKDD